METPPPAKKAKVAADSGLGSLELTADEANEAAGLVQS